MVTATRTQQPSIPPPHKGRGYPSGCPDLLAEEHGWLITNDFAPYLWGTCIERGDLAGLELHYFVDTDDESVREYVSAY
jgi:hypothetical protein